MNRTIGSFDPKSNNFDFLRFCLATAVIFGHSMPEYQVPHIPLLKIPLTPGFHAVNFFFAISGFLICGSWFNSRGAGDYARKRILRIYPGMTAALLLCVAIVGPLGGANLSTYFTNPRTYRFFMPLVLGPAQLLPGVFDHMPWGGSVDGPLWTIRFEICCYILLGLLGVCGLLKRPPVVLALFCTSLMAFFIEYKGYIPGYGPHAIGIGIEGNIARLTTFFLAGTVFYLYRDRIKLSAVGAVISGLVVLLLHNKIMPIAISICGSYLLFFLAFSPSIKLNRFGKFGDFSYGLYIYAFPLQQLLIYHIGHRPSLPVFFILSFLCTLPVAVASWYFIEKPFLKLKKKTVLSPSAAGAPDVEGVNALGEHTAEART